ncbi:MAG: secondary thiamine-phosphate synthase enzyme YjbQ [candidate division Zixibacteria bacterium]|nr:secondary thiamine-phosphate synthase enzyme YjbQ [candidate division Zixibacteria bacterium]
MSIVAPDVPDVRPSGRGAGPEQTQVRAVLLVITTSEIKFKTHGSGDIVDITGRINDAVGGSGLESGTVTIFVPGSTGGITTIEYEPGLLKDVPELMEKLVPSDRSYKHDETWHDGNGFSHLRAALIGPDITVPFVGGKPTLGTWQQVVFLEFDNRPRTRTLVLQIAGE